MKKIVLSAIIFLVFVVSITFLISRANEKPSPKQIPILRGFVKTQGKQFILNGQPYLVNAANNYYVTYKSERMVNELFKSASANNISLIRTWGFMDTGSLTGEKVVNAKKEGIYFQYWNGDAPAYNDSETGLQKLDYVVYKAQENGVRLLIPLTNNWQEFGGIDQYVAWKGEKEHDLFFTDPIIKQWYKNYVSHLLNRVNQYTGVAYKNDPTIMGWELANEPRCKGVYPASKDCTTDTITNWAVEMSSFIKTIDTNHIVGVGDEGFYCIPKAKNWKEDCSQGIDTEALSRIKTVDYISVHAYPDKWSESPDEATQWISRHRDTSFIVNKPLLLGEFGLQDKTKRIAAYKAWVQALGPKNYPAVVWMLADKTEDNKLYPDYDGYTIYCPSKECDAVKR